ncbi:MAG: protease pro-enzyme activation domain-containing protein [Candidatus Dormibacteria bacterium]
MFRGLGLIAALAIVATLAPVGADADAAGGTVAVGSVPGVSGADRTGDLGPRSPVHVQLALRRQNQAELEALTGLAAPPRVAAADVRAHFSPTHKTVDATTGFLRSRGFTGITVSADRTLVGADATATVAQSALGTQLARFRERSGGRTFRTNVSAPVLPAWLAGQVAAIHGLDDRPAARRRAAATLGAPGGYTPAQLRSLYTLANAPLDSTDGSGQTIGVLELTDFNPAHIASYDMAYYPPTSQPSAPTPVLVDGGPDHTCCTNQVEAELDIEVIHAIAPKATIRVYEAPNVDSGQNDAFSQMISDRVNVITTSWGMCEQLTNYYDGMELGTLRGIFQTAAALNPPINVYAATGDSGAYDCRDPSNPNDPNTVFRNDLAVDSPASDPNVIGVGGTRLYNTGDYATYSSEAAWSSSDGLQGGGGGLSTGFAAPPWQALTGISSGRRQVPDVSFDGDPNSGISVCTFAGGDTALVTPCSWEIVGGTSAGSPAWAAYNALYNQYSASVGGSPMDRAGPTLYAAAACPAGASPFHDVASGSNLYYSAGTGFDLASGWGSMNGAALASNINGQSTAALQVTSTSPNQAFTGGGTRVNVVGCGFKHVGDTPPSVFFGGRAAASVTWVNSAQLQVTIPSGPAQAVNVSVVNPGGGSATLPSGFTYVNPPPPPPPGPPPPAGGTDLYGTLLNGGASGVVEVHGLSQHLHYSQFMLHAATAFSSSPAADWRFFVASYHGDGRPDLIGVHLRGTGSGHVEVHVLSAASGYSIFVLHTATPMLSLPSNAPFQFALGSLDGDRRSNLFAVAMSGTGSGTVELHVLSDSSGYNSWVLHSATALLPVNGSQWQFRVGDAAGRGDLIGILHSSSGSGNTEVHALSRDSGYQGFSLHTATPLGPTADSQFVFSLGDHDADGVPDIYAIVMNGTGSGRTEVHVLSGGSNYTAWVEHAVTPLVYTSANWQFSAR